MHIVVLQRPESTAACDHWIREAAPETHVTIISGSGAKRQDRDLAPGVRRILVEDYASAAVLGELLRICGQDRPDRVLANSENDVLRTAEARTIFGIPGQKSRLALAFRDKVAMKSLFAGLSTPPVPYRLVGCVEDVFTARRELGAIVVKPRDGSGAVGVLVFASDKEIRDACIADPGLVARLHGGRLMAEQYVSGAVYHVDVVVNGPVPVLVSPSRYTCPPHRFGSENLGSVMLDNSSATGRLLSGAAREFVERLPPGHGVSILHLEYLADGCGRLLAGEVACRGGGALVKNSIRHTYGVDTSRLACLIGAGLWTGGGELVRVAAQTGWILWTGGPALAAPAARPGWLVQHSVTSRPGEAASSVDAKAAFLVRGADETEITQRLAALAVRD
ncbi:MAG TPA: hypothetical protein VGL63_06840 [Streptosporangiaceae bacterium]|jgi:hypothetical protein